VNAHGYSGPTPLTEAVDNGLTNFVKVLLEAGADPNIPNQVTIALFSSLCLLVVTQQVLHISSQDHDTSWLLEFYFCYLSKLT
jgi:ankyrin repeat protein